MLRSYYCRVRAWLARQQVARLEKSLAAIEAEMEDLDERAERLEQLIGQAEGRALDLSWDTLTDRK